MIDPHNRLDDAASFPLRFLEVRCPRVLAQCIDVSIVPDEEAPTPMDELLEKRADEVPHAFTNGTRAAADACVDKLVYQCEEWTNKPRLEWSALSCTVTAVCGYDHADWLLPHQCVVTNGSEFMRGPVAVWRYPCHSPQDICVLEAVCPPEGCFGPIELNCIIYSPHGNLSSLLAGGDLDGDGVCVCGETALVSFVEYTQSFVDGVRWKDIKEDALRNLPRSATSWPSGLERSDSGRFILSALVAGSSNAACARHCCQHELPLHFLGIVETRGQEGRAVSSCLAGLGARGDGLPEELSGDGLPRLLPDLL